MGGKKHHLRRRSHGKWARPRSVMYGYGLQCGLASLGSCHATDTKVDINACACRESVSIESIPTGRPRDIRLVGFPLDQDVPNSAPTPPPLRFASHLGSKARNPARLRLNRGRLDHCLRARRISPGRPPAPPFVPLPARAQASSASR
jgi:hypothetical protein